jgi:ABC-type transporter MlaC component
MIVTLVIGGTRVMAANPTENLKSLIGELLTILNNPAYRAPAQRCKAVDLVEKVADSYFDFREMAKSSLGDAWDDLNQTQQDEFVKNFTAVLKNSYSRALFAFAKAKVIYLPEIRHPDHVEVPVVIRPPNDKFPLIFRMRKEGHAWRIYNEDWPKEGSRTLLRSNALLPSSPGIPNFASPNAPNPLGVLCGIEWIACRIWYRVTI